MKKNKGFSLIEIIISIAILATVFSFIFYFVSTIAREKNIDNKPHTLDSYNYSDKSCSLKQDSSNIKSYKTIMLTKYIPPSVPITSLNIFDKNKLIVTTNSASTTESDIFIFKIDNSTTTGLYELLYEIDTGPGINDALLHDDILYVANSSVNSHIQLFVIHGENELNLLRDIKVDELSESYSIAKKIYLDDKRFLLGAEKNNYGGELFVFDLFDHLPRNVINSVEIDGQVNSIYSDQNIFYIANASDIELLIYDEYFNLINSYDAPLSSGNGKSVSSLFPNIYLGRTLSSFELFLLSFENNIVSFVNKYKTYGIDFIHISDRYIMLMTSNNSLQLFDYDMKKIKGIVLPNRVNAYACIDQNILIATINPLHTFILWIN